MFTGPLNTEYYITEDFTLQKSIINIAQFSYMNTNFCQKINYMPH